MRTKNEQELHAGDWAVDPTLAYVEKMACQLAQLVLSADHPLLAYLFELVALETDGSPAEPGRLAAARS